MNNVVISKKAFLDLKEIKTYISKDLSNPIAAENTINGILDKIEQLKHQSQIGVPLYFNQDLFSGYRFVIYKSYLAFYRIVNDNVFVDRIIYGKRDYMAILFNEKLDEADKLAESSDIRLSHDEVFSKVRKRN